MTIALMLIPKRDRGITSCQKCARTIDLRGGGLYFFDVSWKRPRPVCPWCVSPKCPQVAMAGALYARAAQAFNRENPEHAANFALIQTIDVLDEFYDGEMAKEPEEARETVHAG